MADIIYAQPQGGNKDLVGQLLPVGILAVLGYVAYRILPGLLSGAGASSVGGLGGGGGTPSQGTNTGPETGPVTAQGGYGPGVAAVYQATRSVPSVPQPVIQPGGNILTIPTAPASPVFVVAGPETPSGFFPGGQGVLSTSRAVTAAEQTKILQNLANSGIANAWWSTEQTISQTTQPGGINSAGSFQSDIPVGKRHCPCTAALRASGVCGPNDDWYYC